MNWQEIMDQVLEISELQDQVLLKSQNQIIKEIVKRKKKYLANKPINLTSLNNAVLEHKLQLTPYQITIIEKINNLSLATSIQQIYINMPSSLHEAQKYVTELKENYILAISCFDLVMNIEKISETECDFNYPFENSIYAKQVNLENELFHNCILKNNITSQEMLELTITNVQKQFISSLSEEEKQQLFIETLVLSYDRNVFEFFNGNYNILKASTNISVEISEIIYNLYKSLLVNLNNKRLSNMPLGEIYNQLKIIYETEFFKQKIKKK